MNKEEAHKILCRNILPCLIGEWREAISIATKALEAEPHWIPVTEKLPEESGSYQVTTTHGKVATYVFGADSISSHEYWKRCVLAWMPLPEPYKGVTE